MTRPVSPTPDLENPSAQESSARVGIHSEALRRLRRGGYSALRDISCEVHGPTARLRGRLPSHDLKQLAQAIVDDVDGVRRVVNLIEVTTPQGRPSPAPVRATRAEVFVDSGNEPHLLRGVERLRTPRKESGTMLVLSRKSNESIVIDGNIRVTVIGIRGNQVRLGIVAPDQVGILREELCGSRPDPQQTSASVGVGDFNATIQRTGPLT